MKKQRHKHLAQKPRPPRFTYAGDGKGKIVFYHRGEPMWEKDGAFEVDRARAKDFVDHMNSLSPKDLIRIGERLCSNFYKMVLTAPQTEGKIFEEER